MRGEVSSGHYGYLIAFLGCYAGEGFKERCIMFLSLFLNETWDGAVCRIWNDMAVWCLISRRFVVGSSTSRRLGKCSF